MSGFNKIVLATIIFSMNPILFRLVDLDPLTILWTVDFIAVICIAPFCLRNGVSGIPRLRKKSCGLFFLASVFTANNVLYISAIKITSLANAVLSHYSAPVFLLLIGYIFIRERVNRSSIFALQLSLGGLILVMGNNGLNLSRNDSVGVILGIGSAVFFAAEILYKKILVEHFRADWVVLAYLSISVILLAPFVSYKSLWTLKLGELLLLLICGVVGSAVGVTLFTSGLRSVRAGYAGIVSYLEPCGVILWGAMVLAELPDCITLLGGGMILVGTYLARCRNLADC